jgi:hypothetical protein
MESVNTVPVVVCPRPFTLEGRMARRIPAGKTIADILREFDLDPDRIPARVFLDDCLIENAYWHRVRPKAGHALSVRVIPADSGNSKDILRIVAMIGVLALAIFVPPAIGLAGPLAAFASAGIGIIGSLAISALIPPSQVDLSKLGNANIERSPTYSITGARNEMNLYGAVPKVFGRVRVWPPYGAEPYTEIVGNNQYLRVLFCLGYGPLVLSDFKIGETPLEQFEEVEIEVRQGYASDLPITLYSNDVHEDGLTLLLTKDSGWQQRTSQPDADELSVDITFPQGIYRLTDKADAEPITAYIRIEYKPVGAPETDWIQAGPLGFFEGSNFSIPTNPRTFDAFHFTSMTSGNTNMVRRGLRWKPVQGRGQYEVRIRRNPNDSAYIIDLLKAEYDALPESQKIKYFNGGLYRYTPEALKLLEEIQWAERQQVELEATPKNRIFDEGYWTCLRTIKTQDPIRLKGLSTVAMRIRGTDQLQGVIDSFNCVAEAIYPTWNGFEWVNMTSRNPASAYRYVFQGAATAVQMPDHRLHLTQIQDWSTDAQVNGRECNMMVDYQTTVYEVAKLIASSGRASVHNQDGKYTVVRDRPHNDPVQYFTPRNSWGFRATKAFTQIPHGLKVSFMNEAKGYVKDEIIVYQDGYNADGSNGLKAATTFEPLDLVTKTSAAEAYRDGRYNLAQAILRPEVYELNTDFENLRCTRGDLVEVTHDVTQWGIGSGRILSVTTNIGGAATDIVVDRPLTMDSALRYAVRYRRNDGTQYEQEIVSVDGDHSTLTFKDVIEANYIPQVDNLFGYGEVGLVSTRLLIKAIARRVGFDATLTLLDEAPAIHTSDTEPLPAFDPRITIPLQLRQPLPPVVDEIISDERALVRDPDGSFRSRILIRMHYISGLTQPATVEVRYKRSDSTESWQQTSVKVTGDADQLEITPVQDLYYYDILIRAVSKFNVPSQWVTIRYYQVISKSKAPVNVGTLILQDNRLSWSYPDPPEDMLGFVVRMQVGDRTSWSDASPLHDYVITNSHFDLSPDSGPRTYLVKAVDTSWYESEAVAALYVDWGNRIVENVIESINYEELGFPGEIVNGTIVGENLEADADSPAWGADSAPAWRAPSENPWADSFKEMTYTFMYTPPETMLTGTLLLDVEVE